MALRTKENNADVLQRAKALNSMSQIYYFMASESKEEHLLQALLGNSPLGHWHFQELLKETGMSRGALNKWLKKYTKEGLLKRVKEPGKFPYFTAGEDNPVYKSKKKQYILDKIYESGLIAELLDSDSIQVAIIFGSAARGDWYKGSDIDLFILGDTKGMKKTRYETRLGRDIELHEFASREEVKEVKTGLMKNVINGYLIKGKISDFAEVGV